MHIPVDGDDEPKEEQTLDAHLLTDVLLSENGPDYVIRYSDLHPFHGGEAFELHSSGELVFYTGQSEADSQIFRVSKKDVSKVRDLFIKCKLWR